VIYLEAGMVFFDTINNRTYEIIGWKGPTSDDIMIIRDIATGEFVSAMLYKSLFKDGRFRVLDGYQTEVGQELLREVTL
jgi:hypothetical protein